MKILLDTCSFLWIIDGSNQLSQNAKSIFSDPANDIYLSSVSIWEIVVKNQIGQLPLPDEPHEFIIKQRKLHRIESLSLNEDAVSHLSRLPKHHNDPFDRMLICQAISNGLTILTPDKLIIKYPVLTTW